MSIDRDRRIGRSGLIGYALRLKTLLCFAGARQRLLVRLDHDRARLSIDDDDRAIGDVHHRLTRADDGGNAQRARDDGRVRGRSAARRAEAQHAIARQRRRIRWRKIAPDNDDGIIGPRGNIRCFGVDEQAQDAITHIVNVRRARRQQWIAEGG